MGKLKSHGTWQDARRKLKHHTCDKDIQDAQPEINGEKADTPKLRNVLQDHERLKKCSRLEYYKET